MLWICCALVLKSSPSVIMPRRRLSCLSCLSVEQFRSISPINIKAKRRHPRTHFADGVASLPSSHQWTVNNGLRFPPWARFIDPLLATRYLFGIRLCYQPGLVLLLLHLVRGEQPSTRVSPYSRGSPRFLRFSFVNYKVPISPRIIWSYTPTTNHRASLRYHIQDVRISIGVMISC